MAEMRPLDDESASALHPRRSFTGWEEAEIPAEGFDASTWERADEPVQQPPELDWVAVSAVRCHQCNRMHIGEYIVGFEAVAVTPAYAREHNSGNMVEMQPRLFGTQECFNAWRENKKEWPCDRDVLGLLPEAADGDPAVDVPDGEGAAVPKARRRTRKKAG